MKVLETKIYRGPNRWSSYRQQLIDILLDLEELEDLPSNRIKDFPEKLEACLPSLYEHHCSEGHDGGFFERLQEGTWMGHIIEHVALELQCLAGMNCTYGRTRSTSTKGVYNVVFAYELEDAGLYACKAAIRLVEKLVAGETYDPASDIEMLKGINRSKGLGPSTRAIVEEALKRNIPVSRLDDHSLIMLGQGIYQKKIRASITSDTSNIGVETAGNKEETKKTLSRAYIPVPDGRMIYRPEELDRVINELGFPLVIKPLDGNHGRGITTNIQTPEQAITAFEHATKISGDVIVERYLEGNDFRFLVINYKLIAVALRTPAMVTGNGRSTIQELIDEVNSDPQRGSSHEKIMTRIRVDALTEKILAAKNYTLETVLQKDEILYLKDTANLSTGGTAKDVTDHVHPKNIFMAERVARLLGLDVCGIDVIAKDISIPLAEQNGGVLEVNACPGLRMHLAPSKGLARNVAEPIVDMLFPEGKPSRLPIVAVTGTNGKTTTTRLIAHMARTAGHKVGFTTTDGIYIQDHVITEGDCTGSQSARTILNDPGVDFAVLECARGGILRSGLGFDTCDIGIVTNVSDDHLGLGGVSSLEEMAEIKSVIPKSVHREGYAILNADDDMVYKMRKDVSGQVALFSMFPDNPRIIRHCENGGLAAVIEKGYLTICKGDWRIRVGKVNQIPLTLGGRAECMIKNIMPAVLSGVIRNFKIEDIRMALQTFIPSPEQTPGRFNIFHFEHYDVMIDYAHNTAGFMEMKKFLEFTNASPKTGIITGVGDRRPEDIRMAGFIAAQMFDEIIIRHDSDTRGRTPEQITELLIEGIHNVDADKKVTVISDEKEALAYAMHTAPHGAFIVSCTEKIQATVDFLREMQQKQQENNNFIQSEKRSFM